MKWGDLMVQVVNWGDLMVQDLHGETCIRKIWVPVPFVNIFMEYYSPLLLLYICFNMGQCAAAAFVNIFKGRVFTHEYFVHIFQDWRRRDFCKYFQDVWVWDIQAGAMLGHSQPVD